MTNKFNHLFGFIILVAFLLLPTKNAWANALPRPTEIWLRFVNQDNSIPNLEGVQLVGCADQECQTPILLKSYGHCDTAGCLTSRPFLSDNWSFNCNRNRCLFVYYYLEEDMLPPTMRLIVQSSGRTWTSASVSPPRCCFLTDAWKVIIEDENLVVAKDTDFQYPNSAYHNFFKSLGITIIVELMVTGFVILVWRRKKEFPDYKLFGAVILANALSYPVAWLTIPSFGPFQYDYIRKIGVIAAIIVGICTFVVISFAVFRPQNRITKILLVLSVLMTGVCASFSILASVYANYTIQVYGLPQGLVIPLAEIFAVAFETMLIFLLVRRDLALRQTALLCVLTNTASFLIGLVML